LPEHYTAEKKNVTCVVAHSRKESWRAFPESAPGKWSCASGIEVREKDNPPMTTKRRWKKYTVVFLALG